MIIFLVDALLGVWLAFWIVAAAVAFRKKSKPKNLWKFLVYILLGGFTLYLLSNTFLRVSAWQMTCCFFVVYVTILFLPSAHRKIWVGAFYALFLISLVFLGHLRTSSRIQIGGGRTLAEACRAANIASSEKELTERLRCLGKDDQTVYKAGPLLDSTIWERYGDQVPTVKHYLFPERDLVPLPAYRPYPLWHSLITDIYGTRKIPRYFYYTGGKPFEGKVVVKLVPAQRRQ